MVLTGLGAVLVGVIFFLVVLAVAGPKSAQQAKKAVFKVGSAKSLAKTVDKSGPLLFQDLLNQSRDIYVQHLGGMQWAAFEAHPADEARRCVLVWQPATRTFLDPCSSRTYPADGAGLTQFAATVNKSGLLSVDLRTVVPPSTTTTPTPPTSTVVSPSTSPPTP